MWFHFFNCPLSWKCNCHIGLSSCVELPCNDYEFIFYKRTSWVAQKLRSIQPRLTVDFYDHRLYSEPSRFRLLAHTLSTFYQHHTWSLLWFLIHDGINIKIISAYISKHIIFVAHQLQQEEYNRKIKSQAGKSVNKNKKHVDAFGNRCSRGRLTSCTEGSGIRGQGADASRAVAQPTGPCAAAVQTQVFDANSD